MDGFSRLIVYLRLSNNNRAESVLEAFEQALAEFGTPSRVRSDLGLENVLCCDRMLYLRGTGRRTWICWKSVHNQRIERFWRDLFDSTIGSFYVTFQ